MKKTKQAKRMLAGLLALLLAVTGMPLYGMEVQAEESTEGELPSTGEDETSNFDISNAEITLENEKNIYAYDGTPKTPSVTVKLNEKILTKDTDYTVSYSDNTEMYTPKNPIWAKVTVTGIGSYTGTKSVYFQIRMTAWEGDYGYQVNIDTNTIKITKFDGGSTAVIPSTIEGRSVTEIGSMAFAGDDVIRSLANVTIPDSVTTIGSGAFASCELKSITIPSSVTSIGMHAFGFRCYEDPDGPTYCWKVSDFAIFGESGSAAEAYARENGFPFNGQDLGPAPQTDISKAAVTLEKTTYPYDGTAKTPAVTVTLDGKTLSPTTDYAVAYTDNVNVGTAKATVTGKGNYKGSVTKTFTITKANNSAGNNGTSDGNGSAGTSNSKQPITCKKKTYTVAYGTKPFKLKVTSNGSLTYKSSNSKIAAVGKTNGKVTIKNTGIAYITAKTKTDSVKITIKAYPKKPSVKSLSVGKSRKLTVKWAKDKRATGYQVQVSTSKNFKKNLKRQNVTKTTCTFKKLKAGSKYYVRLRSYKKSGKNTLYSAWSNRTKWASPLQLP